jgi:hypothetical protein
MPAPIVLPCAFDVLIDKKNKPHILEVSEASFAANLPLEDRLKLFDAILSNHDEVHVFRSKTKSRGSAALDEWLKKNNSKVKYHESLSAFLEAHRDGKGLSQNGIAIQEFSGDPSDTAPIELPYLFKRFGIEIPALGSSLLFQHITTDKAWFSTVAGKIKEHPNTRVIDLNKPLAPQLKGLEGELVIKHPNSSESRGIVFTKAALLENALSQIKGDSTVSSAIIEMRQILEKRNSHHVLVQPRLKPRAISVKINEESYSYHPVIRAIGTITIPSDPKETPSFKCSSMNFQFPPAPCNPSLIDERDSFLSSRQPPEKDNEAYRTAYQKYMREISRNIHPQEQEAVQTALDIFAKGCAPSMRKDFSEYLLERLKSDAWLKAYLVDGPGLQLFAADIDLSIYTQLLESQRSGRPYWYLLTSLYSALRLYSVCHNEDSLWPKEVIDYIRNDMPLLQENDLSHDERGLIYHLANEIIKSAPEEKRASLSKLFEEKFNGMLPYMKASTLFKEKSSTCCSSGFFKVGLAAGVLTAGLLFAQYL